MDFFFTDKLHRKVCNSHKVQWIFTKWTRSCNRLPDQEIDHYQPQSPPLAPHPNNYPPPPKKLISLSLDKVNYYEFDHKRLVLPAFELYTNGIIYDVCSHLYVSGFFCSTLCWWDSSILLHIIVVCLFSLLYSSLLPEYATYLFHYWWSFGLFPVWGYDE